MNINDVKDFEYSEENGLNDIFARQWELIEKYKKIERTEHLFTPEALRININTYKGQALLKDMTGRVWEEIMESAEAFNNNETLHGFEEISDSLHFCCELFIASGYTYKDFLPISQIDAINGLRNAEPEIKSKMFDCLYFLGLARNCLKAKPWKIMPMLTDEIKYKELLDKFWFGFLVLCNEAGLTARDLYNYYFKKATVNAWRIESKY